MLLTSILILAPLTIMQRALASEELYSVDMITYINATGIGVSGENNTFSTIRLVVSKTMEPDGISTLYNATEDTGTSPFVAQQGMEFLAFQDLEENQKPHVSTVFGLTVDLRNAQFGMKETYANGTAIAVNSSDFYTNFKHVEMGVSSVEHTLMFDSPANYAYQYCSDNGYSFNNVINSTFEETYNVAGMNALRTNLVKTDIMLFEPTDTSLNASSMHEQVLDPWTWVAIAIVVVICITAILTAPAWFELGRLAIVGETVRYQAMVDSIAAIAAINAEKEVQLQLSRDIAAFQATLLELVGNGTITIEEAIALNQAMGYPMIEVLNNRSTNIETLLNDYFSHVENQWDKYGALFKTSWTNWIFPIIVLAIILIGLLVTYRLVKGKKTPENSAPNLTVIRN